jgi:hypothetical protein
VKAGGATLLSSPSRALPSVFNQQILKEHLWVILVSERSLIAPGTKAISQAVLQTLIVGSVMMILIHVLLERAEGTDCVDFVTTVDQSDIRGLVTGMRLIRQGLPLSTFWRRAHPCGRPLGSVEGSPVPH